MIFRPNILRGIPPILPMELGFVIMGSTTEPLKTVVKWRRFVKSEKITLMVSSGQLQLMIGGYLFITDKHIYNSSGSTAIGWY